MFLLFFLHTLWDFHSLRGYFPLHSVKMGIFSSCQWTGKWYASAGSSWAAAVFLCLERVSASGFRFAKRETSYNTSYNNEGINSALPLTARDCKKPRRGTLF